MRCFREGRAGLVIELFDEDMEALENPPQNVLGIKQAVVVVGDDRLANVIVRYVGHEQPAVNRKITRLVEAS